MSKYRIGLIGAERLTHDYTHALETLVDAERIGIRRLARPVPAQTVDELRVAQMQHGLHALVISAPQTQQAEIVEAALSLGMHVFCVEPVPASIEDMIRIRAAEYAARGLVLQFGFTVREHDSVRIALMKASDKAYGDLLTLRGVHGLAGLPTEPGRHDEAGGGILIGPGAHMIDLMQAFAGPFQDISAMTSAQLHAETGVEDNVFALMRTYSGTTASLHASATQWRETFRLELGFEHGYLWLEGLTNLAESFGQEVLIYAKTRRRKPGEPSPKGHETVERFTDSNGPLSALDHFVSRIRDRTLPAIGTSQQAFDTLNTIQRIYAADQTFNFGTERHAS